MPSLRAGKLRHQVTIEYLPSSTPVGPGDPPTGWTTFATTWAAIEPMTGRELIAAQAVENVATHLITTRYIAGIKADMRITFGARHFNITSPPRDLEERNKVLEFEVQEGLVDD